MKKVLLVLVSILMLLSSCSLDQTATGKGTISLVIGDVVSRSVDSGISMSTSYYLVSGALSDNSESFSNENTTGNTFTKEVTTGTWIITVDAYNSSDIRIGTGSESLVVTEGGENSCTVYVNELEGSGTLTVSITAATVNSGLTATVSTYGGATTQTISLTASDSDSTLYTGTFTSLANGYYMLQIMDGTSQVALTTLRMVNSASMHYSGTYEASTGAITGSIAIVDNIKSTATAYISLSNSSLAPTDTLTAYAGSSTSVTCTYSWLLNNVPIVENSSSSSLSYDLSSSAYVKEGDNTLQVIIIATDGSAMCDATRTITITEDATITAINSLLKPFESSNLSPSSGSNTGTMSGTIALTDTVLNVITYDPSTNTSTTTKFGTVTSTSDVTFNFDVSGDSSTYANVTLSGAISVLYTGATEAVSYEFSNLKMSMVVDNTSYSSNAFTATYTSSDTFKKNNTDVAEADRNTECQSILEVFMSAMQNYNSETMNMKSYTGSYEYTYIYSNITSTTTTGTLSGTLTGSYKDNPPYFRAEDGQSTANLSITDSDGNTTTLVITGTYYTEVYSYNSTITSYSVKTLTGFSMNGETISVDKLEQYSDCYNRIVRYIF